MVVHEIRHWELAVGAVAWMMSVVTSFQKT